MNKPLGNDELKSWSLTMLETMLSRENKVFEAELFVNTIKLG
jgi:hypothetical protein